ncbi:hypothetical protein EW145_g147 [Phellinidium pouzarii]|uniref:Major facilitator superfamily (MFS) profile domain-containing protein n=1 Tax=Phellinidium pouzarii TaxID=167371 RepID=A0A4S4LJI9_9AGAM|nr:hypothetical protein EW145_g147 [Phellinidium pouzarii]
MEKVKQLQVSETGIASSRSTIVDRDLEAKQLPTDPELYKGEGESALPEDKYTEALERLDEDWQHDPENPRNWTFWRKWRMAGVNTGFLLYIHIASVQFYDGSSITANYGALWDIQYHDRQFDTDDILARVCDRPALLESSDRGHGPEVLHISNLSFLVFNLACAFSPNTGALIAFRFLSGLGGSAPVAIGGGVIGDMFAEHNRATAMAIFTLGPLIGPAVGPVAGGFITETIGFKWIFIVIAIFAGIGSVFGILVLEETYAPVIRIRRAKKEIKSTGERTFEHDVLLGQHQDFAHVMWVNMTRPFALLFGSFICFILSLYMGLMYGYYYLMFATFPTLYEDTYGFSTGIAGLAYLGPGIGFCLSTIYGSVVADGIYRRLSAKNGGVGKPEMRIPALIIASFFVPIGLFWYGWSARASVHWIMPIIGAGIFGFGMMGAFLPIQLYLVDSFRYAASAIAAATVIRSLMGFAFPLFGEQMFAALHNGPGYSLLAGLAIVTGIPFPIWIYYCGEKIRARSDLNR